MTYKVTMVVRDQVLLTLLWLFHCWEWNWAEMAERLAKMEELQK